ncbi:FMN-dependent NADH-azoreductase [Natronocella acetinitrilica]|uniref:FMN dependent NADH:quinone oxidoreductase n=1 Tax=Natronocella acetinitrilica TaxID=414046 RepID=A0AAE3G422_9GAMM|nr:NAD(P)H-dependent oxidoreductase [Natronocella acetinitrilica]MCP1675264.1 FMN-dependent NADH-azoreductase [Natronocella acetinitrilica]
MSTLLQINSSLFSDEGQSSRLSNDFVARWREQNPEGQVIVRDLAAEPIPHLTAERLQAGLTAPEERTAEQQALAAEGDELIEELKQADVIALGLPMYNFSVPSTLKAWFDHVARAGTTFRYTEQGPVGLLENKTLYVFAARGGKYLGTSMDTQTDLVKHFFGLLGVTDVKFIHAEGLAMGDEIQQQALQAARDRIDSLAA